GGNAGRDRRRAPPRGGEDRRAGGVQGAPAAARLRSGREHARGVRGLDQERDRQVGQSDPRRQYLGAARCWSGVRVPLTDTGPLPPEGTSFEDIERLRITPPDLPQLEKAGK